MKHISDKYRRTTTCARVYRDLVAAAEYRGVTTYQHIAMIMGLPTRVSEPRPPSGQVLRLARVDR